MRRPSLPFVVRHKVSGELEVILRVFHLPTSPGPPDTRSNVMDSLDVPPSALLRFTSMVSILPSSESLSVPVLITFPFAFSVVSQVFASTAFTATVIPHGVMLSLPSVLKVYDK